MTDESVSETPKKRFVKGGAPGPGRPKGSQDRGTLLAREAIARFVDGNADRLQGWLDEIAEQHGAQAAFKCFADLLEYHVPKLARMEHAGDQDQPVRLEIGWQKSEGS